VIRPKQWQDVEIPHISDEVPAFLGRKSAIFKEDSLFSEAQFDQESDESNPHHLSSSGLNNLTPVYAASSRTRRS
jgi:hypothetical protein